MRGWSNGATRGDGMQLLRADLVARLDSLERALAARGPLVGQSDVAAIIAIAADYDLPAVRRLAEGLAVTLAAGGRGAAIGPWIERLRDALGCDSHDEGVADTWIAAVMVRLTG